MFEIKIPSRGLFRLQYLVLDLNGTIALDGQLLSGVSERLKRLSTALGLWLVSADTQGTLSGLASQLGIQAKRLDPGDECKQKAEFVDGLGSDSVVAIGNGANDVEMLRQAAIGIAVMGGEGLAVGCLTASDLVVPSIEAALDLLIYPRRLLGTLRA
jgi:P-type E1-E2 ATPase